jgi:type IV pilus assembly protein PilC
VDSIDIKKIKRKSSEKKGNGSILNKELSFSFGNSLGDKLKEQFYNQLYLLLNSGLELSAALELQAQEQSAEKLSKLSQILLDKIIEGDSLSEALRSDGRFNAFEIKMIEIGEEVGKLALIFDNLSRHYEEKNKLRKLIISSLTYPAIVMLTAFAAVFFMFFFIVPLFKDVLNRFEGELPYVTSVVFEISQGLTDHILLVLLIAIGLLISGYYLFRSEKFKGKIQVFFSKLPVIGPMLFKIQRLRIATALFIQLRSGQTVFRSVDNLKESLGFLPLKEGLEKCSKGIYQGESLHEAFRKNNIFEAQLIALVKVGEETNTLPEVFQKISEQYSKDVEHSYGMLSSLIEPFLILGLGIFVGLILVALYLPMLKMSTSFSF